MDREQLYDAVQDLVGTELVARFAIGLAMTKLDLVELGDLYDMVADYEHLISRGINIVVKKPGEPLDQDGAGIVFDLRR